MAMEAINSTFNDRPVVKVYYDSSSVGEDQIKSILYGIEEEGIPFDVVAESKQDAVALAYDASINSRLGVGVGVGKDDIVLHYEKLNPTEPIFCVSRKKAVNHRILGANAARLVKKMPFKDFK